MGNRTNPKNNRTEHSGTMKTTTKLSDQRLLSAIVSLIIAVLATVIMHTYMQGRISSQTGGAPLEVLIATADIPAGTKLLSSHFDIKKIPSSYVGNREVLAEHSSYLEGQTLDENLQKGSQFFWTDIAFSDRASLAKQVPINRRAFAISVDALSGFNGKLQPGDRVDIYKTTRSEGMRAQAITHLVLQNVRVLAVGDRVRPWSRIATATETVAIPSNITLSLTHEEIITLTTSEAEGRISLVLRNPMDVFTSTDTGYSVNSGGVKPGDHILDHANGEYPSIYVEGELKRNGYYPPPSQLQEALKNLNPVILKSSPKPNEKNN